MLDLGVDVSWSGWGTGSLQSDFAASSYYCRQQILAQSEMKLLLLGGNATSGVQAILGDPVAGLCTWIEDGAEMKETSQGLPISYTTHYLRDNRLASFGYAAEWTVEECVPVSRRFHVDIHRSTAGPPTTANAAAPPTTTSSATTRCRRTRTPSGGRRSPTTAWS